MASRTKISGKNQAVTEMLMCSVCMEQYRSPKLLPCFHTFCQRCVETVAGAKPSFPCPTCRTIIVMPPGGAAQLQTNFYLEKDLSQSMASEGPECELCASRSSKFKCIQCQQFCCESCRQIHDSILSCSSHSVLPLGLSVEVGKEGKAVKDPQNCPKHKTQVLMLFCRQCEVSICIQCKLTSHDGHETEDVQDSGERARAELQKEIDGLSLRKQSLNALLSKAEDFKAELEKEKESVGKVFRTRAEQLQSMVAQGLDGVLKSLDSTTSCALADIKEQIQPVKLAKEVVDAKCNHYCRVMNKEDDSDVLALFSQLKTEQQTKDSGQSAYEDVDQLKIERNVIQHTYNDSAVTEGDVAAFLGAVTEGQPQEARIKTSEVLSVKEAPQLLSTKKRGHTSARNQTNTKEIVYSKNQKATLVDMCLASQEKLWIVYNFPGNQSQMALFDSRGIRLEQRYESIYSSCRLACDGDTLVSLTDGKFAGPDGKSGNLGEMVVDKANSFILSQPSPHYFILKIGQVMQFLPGQQSGQQYAQNVAELLQVSTIASSPPKLDTTPLCRSSDDMINNVVYQTETKFAVSAEEKFFAFIYSTTVYVAILTTATPRELKRIANYTIMDAADEDLELGAEADDLIFSKVDGEEMLLVAVSSQNTVHIVDHKDGCCFIRTLETDQRPLNRPFRLATNHEGRVWVGCHGGQVVIFDL